MSSNKIVRVWGVLLCLFFITSCMGGGGSNAFTEPNIELTQSSIDFSKVIVDNYSEREIVIKNTGNANLNIGQITSPGGPFSITRDGASNKTLAPNKTCSLIVRFNPKFQNQYTPTIIPFTSTFSIPSDDPDSRKTNVTLKGEGHGLNIWISQINSTCPNISIDFTVSDSTGPVTGLTKFNFDLWQNDIPIEDINFNVTPVAVPYPVSVVLALDLSGSLTASLQAIMNAAIAFVNQMDDQDEAAICKFRKELEFYPAADPFLITTNQAGILELNDYIDDSYFGPDNTALFDAVYESIVRVGERGTNVKKKAVLVLSDGANNTGEKTLTDVINTAANVYEVPIFTIFYIDANYAQQARPDIMQQMAIETGGQYYSSETSDLNDIFTQISNVLSNRYTITYTSPTCSGSNIPVKVRVDYSVIPDNYYGWDSKTIDLP